MDLSSKKTAVRSTLRLSPFDPWMKPLVLEPTRGKERHEVHVGRSRTEGGWDMSRRVMEEGDRHLGLDYGQGGQYLISLACIFSSLL